MKGGKIIVIAVSGLLVVGLVIGVMVSVNHTHSSSGGDGDVLSKATKAVASICGPTDYKQACVNSLGKVATNDSATPKDFLMAAIDATIKEVKEALGRTGSMANATKDSYQKMGAEDCQGLLQYAIDELQASFSMVGDTDLHTMEDREAELKNWLSAVISYQETCRDGITEPGLKVEMTNGLANATQLTSNALAIVSHISDIKKAFNIPILDAASRHLTEDEQRKQTPSWISFADRKLLQSENFATMVPNAVVAKDGSGQYKTIGAALVAYPKNHRGRYFIYVKAGIYDEAVTVTKDQINVFMYGDGPRKTMVTGRKSNRDGVPTFRTASFTVIGSGFIAKAMGFQNTAGPEGHQAVAVRTQSDMSAFYNCRMDGYQDTLYAQTHRQFYRNCVISGTIDFIFGDAAAVIQNCLIIVRKPMDNQQNTVTAQGRIDSHETTGIVIHNCRILPEQILFPVRFKIPTFLGRPWKQYSRAVIMESMLADFIQPSGWMPWAGNFALDTLYYAEYANRGPGAITNRRVNWKGYRVLSNKDEALQFTTGPFIQGTQWLRDTGAPFALGLRIN